MARHELKCCWVAWLAIGASTAIGQPLPVSFTPLNDLAGGLYLDQFPGGLYPNGSNELPAAHAAEGLARAAAIQPLDALGEPEADGKHVLVSIGMSNTTQEFCSRIQGICQPWSFMGQAAVHPRVNHTSLAIVDGAQGSQPAQEWISPDAETYDRVAQRLAAANVTEPQVTSVWLKQANPRPEISLPSADADAFTLLQHLGDIVRAAKVRYPNLQMMFLSSRIYAGYATTELNPEPYAYESGLAVKWLIEAQINQMTGDGVDSLAGDLDYTSGVAPWLAWGPYLWADGLHPRSDGLIWHESDLRPDDGTHPSMAGQEKVGTMLLDFMLNSPFAQPWFLAALPGDYNRNGVVDAADYTVWRDTLGQTGTGLAADGDGDGTIDDEDYHVWKGNFGAMLGGAAGAARLNPSTSPVVPEPAPLRLMLVGIAGVWSNKRDRSNLGRLLGLAAFP